MTNYRDRRTYKYVVAQNKLFTGRWVRKDEGKRFKSKIISAVFRNTGEENRKNMRIIHGVKNGTELEQLQRSIVGESLHPIAIDVLAIKC